MPSIRARLTATYALALTATLGVFAATLWLARGAAGDRELQRYVNEEAELASRLLLQARSRSGDLPLVETRDSMVGPLLVDRARLLLEALPNVVLLTDTDGRIIYRSVEARLLDLGEAETVVENARRLTPTLAGKLSIRRYMGGEYGAYARSR